MQKLTWLPLALLILVLVAPTSALQQPAAPAAGQAADDQAPAGRGGRAGGRGRGGFGRGMAIRSAEVAADGRVTFRLRAPEAQAVAVNVAGATRPMTKDDGTGVWSLTTDPLEPNFYTYSLVVDGTSINDPSNRDVQTSWAGYQSMFVVPGDAPWFPRAGVPRGAIARHRFQSEIANDLRDFYVYTPPGYDADRAQPYPTLYLLHGLGDDAERWFNGGAANTIFDNLIAEGRAEPMVVVTTLGYGTSAGPGGDYGDLIRDYTRILVTEVMPAVQAEYHVSTDRERRAIAGLSMGGAESIYSAFNHLDTFSWIGSFSGAFVMWQAPPGSPAAQAEPAGRGGGDADRTALFDALYPDINASVNSRINLLWISCGTSDGLVGINREFKAWLTGRGVAFYEEEAEGMGHVWPLWRQDLTNLAQRLFRN